MQIGLARTQRMRICTGNSCTFSVTYYLDSHPRRSIHSRESRTGALTYTAPLLAPIPLQALMAPEDIIDMRKELDLSLTRLADEGRLTIMQRIQYDFLRKILKTGDVGWIEMVLVPSGGIMSPPTSSAGGATVVAILMVSEPRETFEFQKVMNSIVSVQQRLGGETGMPSISMSIPTKM